MKTKTYKTKYKIRKAGVGDVEALYNLGSCVEEFFVSGETGGFWPKKQLVSWVKDKDGVCLVATIKDRIVGFVLSAYYKPTNKVIIENVYVIKDLRKKGVGKKMITALINYVVKQYTRIGAIYIMNLTRKGNYGYVNLMKNLEFNIGYKDWVWIEKELTNEFPKRSK